MLSSANARLAAARRLTRRPARREAGRFLAEGAQAVRAALAADAVVELFATAQAIQRHPALTRNAAEISAKDAAALSETVTPQGIVAVCRRTDVALATALGRDPRLVVGLVEPADPGNAGTVVRTADAAGAQAVMFAGGVDVYNGKVVRASAGSVFHLDVVVDVQATSLIAAARAAGLRVLATTATGARNLDDLVDGDQLRQPTMWLFGSEAHGLPDGVVAAADASVRVPIHGHAESLNVAAAAAVCLYASARAQRR